MKVTHFPPKGARLAALLSLLLFAAGMTKLQAQNITFADPNVKALCVDPNTGWDTNHDGELSYEEAAAVNDLGEVFSNNSSIISFDELQYFMGLTSIGIWAFYYCDSLTSVTIPNSVTSIGISAFTHCIRLPSITLPNSLTSIGNNAFQLCIGLTSIELPSTLTSIGQYGFDDCSGLQSITVLANEPPQLGIHTFDGVYSDIHVYVPCEALNAYQSYVYGDNQGWGGFPNIYGLGGDCKIGFADANVETLCGNRWGSNGELSYNQAADVTDLETVFKGHTEITSFNELLYFTGLTAIGDSAFYGCSNLSSILIPEDVATIGSSAFDGCNSLSSIEIPGAVDSIAKKAFSSCPGLASMTVASGNVTYDSRNRCHAIIETATNTLVAGCIATVIPDDVVSIGDYAFHGLTGLTSVVFPNLLTSIGEGAFGGCTDLTSVTIPANVVSIGKEAFALCTGLESITVHASTPPALEADAFDGVDVSIPVIIPAGTLEDYQASGWNQFNLVEASARITFADANVETLCANRWGSNGGLTYAQAATVTDLESVFKGNGTITSFNELQYFTGLTSLGDSVFHGCQNLASVCIPNGVTSIGTGAFSDCDSLASIEIHRAVIAIGTGAFSGCSSLASIVVASDNRIYDSRNDCNAIIETATNTLVAGCKNTVIPYTVTTIAGRAFYGCTGLTSFVVPNPVAYIGAYAFYQCSGLTTLELLCPLTSIGHYAFAQCTSINSLTLEATTPPALGENVFQEVDTSIPVHIPYGSYKDYYTATGWSSFTNLIDPANIVFADATVKAICVATETGWDTNHDGQLSYDEAASVTVLKGSELGSGSVFKGNTSIISFDELQYFTGLSSIMEEAFWGCSSLTSIKIPSTNPIGSIGYNEFAIKSSAFYGCSSLTSIEIPSNVWFIDDMAFAYCSGLQSLTVLVNTPPILFPNSFEGVDKSIPVYVPCAAVGTYQEAEGWKWFTNINGSGGTCLISFADANVKALCVATETGWDINGDGELSYDEAAAVTNLGEVFYRKTNITSFDELQYFTGLNSISNSAFEGCTNLSSVVIPNSITVIGDYAFSDCSILESIAIPGSVISFGEKVFYNCSSLRSLVVAPDNPVYDSRDDCNAIIEKGSNTLLAGLVSTVIPNSVTAIGNYAFYRCIGLPMIVIPESVTTIGEEAFSVCYGLESLTVQATTPPALGTDAFYGVSPTIPVYIPVGTLAAYQAAEGWNRFTNFVESGNLIDFADPNVKAICVGNWGSNGELTYAQAAAVTDLNGKFQYNYNITSFDELQYFTGLTSIGNQEFQNCTNLTSVRIPNSVTSIEGGAFNSCTRLASIEIPISVNAIGTLSFGSCNALASMTVAAGNPKYDSRNDCNAIIETATNTLVAGCMNTVIPNTVTSIGECAFSINSLSSIEIPASVTFIGDYAFSTLDSLTVHATTPPALGTNVFQGVDTSIPVHIPAGTYSAYRIAPGWSNFTNLIDPAVIVFADPIVKTLCVDNWDTNHDGELNLAEAAAVTDLGTVFTGNTNITSFDELQYFTNLFYIGDSAFYNCTSLASVKIPGKSIKSEAFANCTSLTSFEFPPFLGSLYTIYDLAFKDCTGLQFLTMLVNTPPYLWPHAFEGVDKSIPVYVPCALLDSYQATNWSQFDNLVGSGGTCLISFADESVEDLCVANWDTNHDGALSYDEAAAVTDLGLVFKEAYIESFDELQYFTGLTAIGDSAFYQCSFYSVVLPDAVVSIGNHAFEDCRFLSSIDLLNSVTTIGAGAFSRCHSLPSIEIPNAVTSIGAGAFSRCDSIASMTVASDNPKYDSRDGCNAIIETATNTLVAGCKNSEILNTVTAIGSQAFCGCPDLDTVVIPNSVVSIHETAFSGSNSIASMVVASDNPKYDSRDGCNAIIETATNTLVAGCKNTMIPNSVTLIGNSAFMECIGLTSITIPNSIDSIGIAAFYDCYNLESLIVMANVPPTLLGGVFENVNHGIPVYVPNHSIILYQNMLGWRSFTQLVGLTSQLSITGHGDGTGTGGWNLIASPLVLDVAPADVGNMLNDVYDLYRFDGSYEGAEWRNFKNNANNGFTMLSFGQGYLYANSNDVTLQFVGLKSVSDSYTVDLTSSPAKLGKWNLIGNSFTDAATVSVEDYCRIADSDRSKIVLSSGQVNAMEGIFVEYSETLEEVTFTKATRGARAFGSPMVNIDLRDAEGRLLDRARLRTGEGASMGKLDLMSDPNRLYFRMDGKDYAMVRVNGQGEMPLNFDAAQDGNFTLSVNVEGMDKDYLHLVDNMTGADVDLLATSTGSEATYSFTAKTTDYASRFRLVFSENGGSSTGSAATNFAYISNGNIVITNASANAMLQIVDVMGRVIVSVGGHTRCITTSGIPAGVYVLRLVSGDDVKVQKIIIG